MEAYSASEGGLACLSLVPYPEQAKPRCPLNMYIPWAITSPSRVGRCALFWSYRSVRLVTDINYRIPSDKPVPIPQRKHQQAHPT
jgi:hypothetical protein